MGAMHAMTRSVGLVIAIGACGGGRGGGGEVVEPEQVVVPARIEGRYALPVAGSTAPIGTPRAFVTIDASGAARVGASPADGELVGMPAQSANAEADTPEGTPALAATIASLLGADAPAMVLDADELEEIRVNGCARETGPTGVSWAFSNAMRFEVVAFVEVGAAGAAPTVVLADRGAPAVRVVQAIADAGDARVAVDDGTGAVAALAMHAGGAVALGGALCIRSNRSVEIDDDRIEVLGDGIEHASFGRVDVVAGQPIDRAAIVAAYRAALAADQLDGDDKAVVQVESRASDEALIAVIDAMIEAGETRFILHTRPDLSVQPKVRTGTPRPAR
jgi:hypothetical protein